MSPQELTIRLPVLDQSPVRNGGSPAQATPKTIALAKACEALGYHRYWVAGHHNTNSFAGSAPEVLIARLAAETRHVRVGSGGVMPMHYSPLKVAEQFRMLEVLAPGRIDLGIGPAPGADERTSRSLQADEFSDQERALLRRIEERSIIGTPDLVKDKLLQLARRHGAEELAIVTITYDFVSRPHSYELLAAASGIKPAAADR